MNAAPDGALTDNAALSRFELAVAGAVAFITYTRDGDVLTLTHTEVPAALNGRGIGGRIARAVLEHARTQSLKVVAKCPFVAAYIRKHPDYAPLLAR